MTEIVHANGGVNGQVWCGLSLGGIRTTGMWPSTTCIPCLEAGIKSQWSDPGYLEKLIYKLKPKVPDMESEAWDE